MTFKPVLPLNGLSGYRFLTRTLDRQQSAFASSPIQKTQVQQFKAKFPTVRTADDLVKNRSVMAVVLGAFGLQDDIANRAFIKKVITDGTESKSALANRLSDKRYLALATAMAHLGPSGKGTPSDELTKSLTTKFQERGFEIAVGEQNQTFRLAMSFERDLPDVMDRFNSDRARWFAVLGNPPLRNVIQTALGLPREFGALTIEQQADRLQDAARKRFGTDSVKGLTQPEVMASVVQRFLIMAELKPDSARFVPALSLFARSVPP